MSSWHMVIQLIPVPVCHDTIRMRLLLLYNKLRPAIENGEIYIPIASLSDVTYCGSLRIHDIELTKFDQLFINAISNSTKMDELSPTMVQAIKLSHLLRAVGKSTAVSCLTLEEVASSSPQQVTVQYACSRSMNKAFFLSVYMSEFLSDQTVLKFIEQRMVQLTDPYGTPDDQAILQKIDSQLLKEQQISVILEP